MGRTNEFLSKRQSFRRDIVIFVTVGTHEQQFNRLIQNIDYLVKEKKINDEVFIQIGYSTYIPKYCNYKKVIGYSEMESLMSRSDVIITHGGPASIFFAQKFNKKPIVLPRRVEFDEHVDNHQVKFCEKIQEHNNIYYLKNLDDLHYFIKQAKEEKNFKIENNNKVFLEKFEKEINDLFR